MKNFCMFVVCVAVLFGGCSKQAKTEKKASGTLIVWSSTDDVKTMLVKYYIPAHPGVTVEYSLTPADLFQAKLDAVLSSGVGAPDVFALEDSFVRKYIESGLLLDLSDIASKVTDKQLAYPVDVGSFGGKTYGLSWQAAPGAMFYRRSIAKKYLGTDDPVEVQKYVSNFDAYLETAALLKEKSKGSCVIVSSYGDMFNAYKGARIKPWIIDGKLYIDPTMIAYMDMSKTFKEKGFDSRSPQWSESWFAGMKGTLKNGKGSAIEVFSYMLPTWGFQYVLKTNAPDTSGDWGMVAGPAPYRWGGTWIGAFKGTKNPIAAKDFIRYVTSDDGFLEAWARDTVDLVSSTAVIAKIQDSYSEPFLGGQNHMAQFAEIAKKVNGTLFQKTDQDIETLFNAAILAYIQGEKSRDATIEDFKSQVKAKFGF